MNQKIKEPVGLEVHQVRKIIDSSAIGEQGVQTETRTIELDEKLIYDFPARLRSEILSDKLSRFYVESGSQFIKISDGAAVSLEKFPVDFYTDILLYRNHESLLRQLILAGVNTEKVTFQRLDNRICYFIGQPPAGSSKKFPGLWIEKDSFFPVLYVIKKNTWTIAFHYMNWQRVSRTWYPMEIRIFVDDQLFADIEVQGFELKSTFSSNLFDVDYIQEQYPVKDRYQEEVQKIPGKMDELDKQIEDFRKLYE
ncbi:MAG: hypothetical protein KAH09_03685 [Desulfobacula sp.]|nr:hypothetical protein [Desulfobacula sp.]